MFDIIWSNMLTFLDGLSKFKIFFTGESDCFLLWCESLDFRGVLCCELEELEEECLGELWGVRASFFLILSAFICPGNSWDMFRLSSRLFLAPPAPLTEPAVSVINFSKLCGSATLKVILESGLSDFSFFGVSWVFSLIPLLWLDLIFSSLLLSWPRSLSLTLSLSSCWSYHLPYPAD